MAYIKSITKQSAVTHEVTIGLSTEEVQLLRDYLGGSYLERTYHASQCLRFDICQVLTGILRNEECGSN